MKRFALFFLLLPVLTGVNSCGSASSIPIGSLNANAWELEYITGLRIAFDGLYPDKKPFINFNAGVGELGGDTSCNVFTTKVSLDGDKINVSEVGAMTMRFCEGGGEQQFLNMLYKADHYKIDDSGKLVLTMNGIEAMRFHKKELKP